LLHLRKRRLLVDFHQEVHAALQIQAERHAVRADRAQPAGYGGRKVQRHDVLIAQFGLQRIGRGELHLGVGEAREQALAIEFDILELELLRLQHAEDLFLQRRIDGRAAIRRDLHRRLLREHDRQRINDAEQDHRRDQDVLPTGKFVHYVRSHAAHNAAK
jgi:hypothetical protein